MKPYSSGNCSAYTSCMLCSADPECGWCDSQSDCRSRDSATCGEDSDWLVTFPLYCGNCTDHSNCKSCTEVTTIFFAWELLYNTTVDLGTQLKQ